MISTLQKLVGLDTSRTHMPHSTVNFNANLPINVEVLEQMDKLRYRLKIGRKELNTKSQKPLFENEVYWGDFSQGEEGILKLSQLIRQPHLFQDKSAFLEAKLNEIIPYEQFSPASFHKNLLEQLLNEHLPSPLFRTFSYMLLALSKGVVHLPLQHEAKRCLLQFSLNKQRCSFYLALENMGPIEGIITPQGIEIFVLYEKSLFFLEKQLPKLDMIASLDLRKEIHPLFDTRELMLDMKG